MKRSTVILLLLTIAAAVGWVASRVMKAERNRPPNIILIGIDTLRADALGCYGAPPGRTPAIDRLAEEGVVFTAAYAASGWTLPSFASIMTGLYPPAHGATSDDHAIPATVATLAEQLTEAGYQTAAFTGGGWVSADYGFGQGFGVFEASGRPTTLAERISRAGRWRRERAAEDDGAPYFLFLHAYDPHDPYAPAERPTPEGDFVPPQVLALISRLFDQDTALTPTQAIVTAYTYPIQRPGVGHGVRQSLEALSAKGDTPIEQRWQHEADFAGAVRWLHANYEAEVAELDAAIAALVQSLEASGERDNTVVVVMSDHGEAFMEHGRLEHRHVDPPVVRVPLIVSLPPRLRAGEASRVEDVVSGADILPTLLDYAGRKPSGPVQGRTLRGLIQGEAAPPVPAPSFVEIKTLTEESSIRFQRHRLIVGGPRDPNGTGALFDLATDQDERVDLAEQQPDLHRKLMEMLENLRDQSLALGTQFGSDRVGDLDPETRQRLIELGYLGN